MIYDEVMNWMFGGEYEGEEDTEALLASDIFPQLDNNPDAGEVPLPGDIGQDAIF